MDRNDFSSCLSNPQGTVSAGDSPTQKGVSRNVWGLPRIRGIRGCSLWGPHNKD